MKLISYDPKEIKNIPAFFNKYLEEYKDEKYIMFIFNDIIENVKDKQAFCDAYMSLLMTLDLPFAFFPYYIHFNKILPDLIAKPSPRIAINLKDRYFFNVVQEPSYGMLILDVEKLNSISFRFNEDYKLVFYIQDLIKRCFETGLYFSMAFFIDVYRSYDMFNSDFKNGHVYDAKEFLAEKQAYFKALGNVQPEQINGYVEKLKQKYGEEIKEETKETK